MCEDCKQTQPSFGLPAEGQKRWCAKCAKGHAGAQNLSSKKCEVRAASSACVLSLFFEVGKNLLNTPYSCMLKRARCARPRLRGADLWGHLAPPPIDLGLALEQARSTLAR